MDENREILSAVFGEDWEMVLIAHGLVGGTKDEEIYADQQAVIALAEKMHPGLADDLLDKVGDAWMMVWDDNPDPRLTRPDWLPPVDDDAGG